MSKVLVFEGNGYVSVEKMKILITILWLHNDKECD